jgi:hypothetical protein
LALLLVLVFSASFSVAEEPPTELRLEHDHWSAWDAPDSQPQGTEVYVVAPGDTLWGLAQRFLGDPYLWPQLWERNRYILDSHWIYPGDPLVMGLTVAEPQGAEDPELTDSGAGAADRLADAGGTGAGDAEDGEDHLRVGAGAAAYPFVQLGTADDIYCSGYVGGLKEEFPFQVSGSEFEVMKPRMSTRQGEPTEARWGVVDTVKVGLSFGDIVYLDRGADGGLRPGDLLSAVLPGRVVRHPTKGGLRGRFYRYSGRVQVLAVQETSSIGEIVHSCFPIPVGTSLKAFTPEPVPSERRRPMRPPTHPASRDELEGAATIILAKDNIVTVGQDHVVFIDQGEEDDLVPGDILTVYRVARSEHPVVVLGEIAVLSVRPNTSVAKVIRSRHPMFIGDLALVN